MCTEKVELTQPFSGCLCTRTLAFFGFGFGFGPCRVGGCFGGCFVELVGGFSLSEPTPWPQLPGGGFGLPSGHVSGGFPQLLSGPPWGWPPPGEFGGQYCCFDELPLLDEPLEAANTDPPPASTSPAIRIAGTRRDLFFTEPPLHQTGLPPPIPAKSIGATLASGPFPLSPCAKRFPGN
jgi:hypothetical protein